jgi:hypothetical protein
MSFFKRLFGGGEGKAGESGGAETKAAGEAEHKGFLIRATPFKHDGQYQTCGVISKEIDGVVKEHNFIRADRFASLEDTVMITLNKGRQIVDEQGERLFKQ